MHFASFQVMDDFRVEANGKYILVGQYDSEIVFPALPGRLDRLYFNVKVRSPLDNPLPSSSVRIEIPGDGVFNFDLPAREINKEQIESFRADGVQFLTVQGNFQIAPIEFSVEGRVKVFVVPSVGDEIYAGSVKVRAPVPEEVSFNPANALAGVAYFSLCAKELGKDAPAFANHIMKVLGESLPKGLIEGMNPDLPLFLPIGLNELAVFFNKPREKVPNITPKFFPAGIIGEVTAISRFGFSVKVEEGSPPLEGFTFEEG